MPKIESEIETHAKTRLMKKMCHSDKNKHDEQPSEDDSAVGNKWLTKRRT